MHGERGDERKCWTKNERRCSSSEETSFSGCEKQKNLNEVIEVVALSWTSNNDSNAADFNASLMDKASFDAARTHVSN